MDTITYSTARASLSGIMDKVVNDHEPLIITRSRQPSVVMLSLEDYTSMQETAYLLRSPANAKRLLESITQLDSGQGQTRTLVD